MAGRNINVSLTPELEHFVSARVASGRYESASEVVREALRLLEERDGARELAFLDFRNKVTAGYEQAKRGQLIDGEQVFRELGIRERKRLKRILRG